MTTITIKEIKSAIAQRTYDGGSNLWRKFCDEILPCSEIKITKKIKKEINSLLTLEERKELKSII